MKLILRLSLIIFALSSGGHALAMPALEGMPISAMGVEAHSDSSFPNSCVDQCIAKTHDFSTALAGFRIPQFLPILLLIISLMAFAPFVARLIRGGLTYVARPPDFIKLYSHYRI